MKEIKRFIEGEQIPENAKYLDCFMPMGEQIVFLYEVPIREKKEKENDSFEMRKQVCINVIDHLNKVTSKRFKWQSAENKKLIVARMNDGHSQDDFIKVIDNMASEWLEDPKMSQYLRPSTLFRASKFENYLNHKSGADVASDAINELSEFC